MIPSSVDHLIIGSGIAGLSLAIRLAEKASSAKILVLSKNRQGESNTWYAQGGIASVLDKDDDFDSHVEDTLTAGEGLCHEAIVRKVVEGGPAAIRDLSDWGMPFTKRSREGPSSFSNLDQDFHLYKEGGHSQRRVAHVGDHTGEDLWTTLFRKASSFPSITFVESVYVVDLITSDQHSRSFGPSRCLGAYVFCPKLRKVFTVSSGITYLGSGGCGKVFLYTSNPDVATGDGLAMAWRAGCRMANLECCSSIRPACTTRVRKIFFLPKPSGEGGVLLTQSGERLMKGVHAREDLAPRDVVARTIDAHLKKSGTSFALLDLSTLGEKKLRNHFPNLLRNCQALGYDVLAEPLPVVPAAHYACGGVLVDEFGCTDIEGLYALGEVSCTGLHGANRLASNSLLEGLVFSQIIADHVFEQRSLSGQTPSAKDNLPKWKGDRQVPAEEIIIMTHSWDEVRRLMWNYVGIVRSDRRLMRAKARVASILAELSEFYWEYQISCELLEVRNLAQVSELMIRSAMQRKESRGVHFNIDYPIRISEASDTVLR